MRNKGIGGKSRSIRLWARSLELESAGVVMFLSSDIKGLAMKRTSLCVMPGNAIRELDRSAFGGVVRGVMDDQSVKRSRKEMRKSVNSRVEKSMKFLQQPLAPALFLSLFFFLILSSWFIGSFLFSVPLLRLVLY